MEIIDNFRLPSKRYSDINPWVEKMLARIAELSHSDFILRLSGERIGRDVKYQLYNNKNKTYAAFQKYNGTLQLHLLARALPDPETGFKPPVKEAAFHSLSFNESGIGIAAELVQRFMDQETPYSQEKVTRIKVTPTARPLIPWTFSGGRISELVEKPTGLDVVVEEGLHTYFIPYTQLEAHRPTERKYVLFNEEGQFYFISSSEFEFYFEMKYDT